MSKPGTPACALPDALIQAVIHQRVVLFLGAGASMEAKDKSGKSPPSALQLRDQLADRFFGKSMGDYDLMSLSELAIQSHGEGIVF